MRVISSPHHSTCSGFATRPRRWLTPFTTSRRVQCAALTRSASHATTTSTPIHSTGPHPHCSSVRRGRARELARSTHPSDRPKPHNVAKACSLVHRTSTRANARHDRRQNISLATTHRTTLQHTHGEACGVPKASFREESDARVALGRMLRVFPGHDDRCLHCGPPRALHLSWTAVECGRATDSVREIPHKDCMATRPPCIEVTEAPDPKRGV